MFRDETPMNASPRTRCTECAGCFLSEMLARMSPRSIPIDRTKGMKKMNKILYISDELNETLPYNTIQ